MGACGEDESVGLQSFLDACRNVLSPYAFEALSENALEKFSPAEYIALSEQKEDDKPSWRQSALALPVYMHFTSPIRRYADILIHRRLKQVLYGYPFSADPKSVGEMVRVCNATHRRTEDVEVSNHNYVFNQYLKLHYPKGLEYHNAVVRLIILHKTRTDDKNALEIYIPLLRQTRSISFKLLGLCFIEEESESSKTQEKVRVALKEQFMEIKIYERLPVYLVPGDVQWTIRMANIA